ncbi:hypothetical protein D6821_01495 [Candidatus Parcubacteria bacterium]|nr:MAG: hypothetical protein D6821_01495 [Candidatus Parcubacteria bacterium]
MLQKLLKDLNELNLPLGEFVIFGSAPLAIRNLRPCRDLDILVSPVGWQQLIRLYPQYLRQNLVCLKKGKIEIFYNWPGFSHKEVSAIIKEAEMFMGFPFARLYYVWQWKKRSNRLKDKKDVELIEKFFGNKNNRPPISQLG